jgi:rhodanese-related sulfurtransferase
MKSSFPALDRKVPESKKYSHVGSSINTGHSAKNTSLVSASATAKKRNEVFKRIKAATLARLLEEREVNETVYALGSVPEDAEHASVSSVKASKAPGTVVTAMTSATCASTPGSVLSVCDSDTTIDQARDLVLLDLRDESEYEQCRLPLALSYPATKINRDQFTPELHRCKRDLSKLLVVYSTNDSTTASVATLLAQKGWDNVHALSGGFEEMASSYPEVFEGEVPERPGTGSTTATGRSSLSRRT